MVVLMLKIHKQLILFNLFIVLSNLFNFIVLYLINSFLFYFPWFSLAALRPQKEVKCTV